MRHLILDIYIPRNAKQIIQISLQIQSYWQVYGTCMLISATLEAIPDGIHHSYHFYKGGYEGGVTNGYSHFKKPP